jgi:hypothetical protein
MFMMLPWCAARRGPVGDDEPGLFGHQARHERDIAGEPVKLGN